MFSFSMHILCLETRYASPPTLALTCSSGGIRADLTYLVTYGAGPFEVYSVKELRSRVRANSVARCIYIHARR